MTRQLDFDQYTEYKTASGIFRIPLAAHALDAAPTLAALATGYEHAATLGRPASIDTAELDAVKAAAAEVYADDVIEHEIEGATDAAAIVANLLTVQSYPKWGAGLDCVADVTIVFDEGTLWVCVQNHRTYNDPNWKPANTPALWKRYYEPEAGPQPWVQPTGAQDAYNEGDRVIFEGNIWESTIDTNVWSPTAYPAGWLLIGPA